MIIIDFVREKDSFKKYDENGKMVAEIDFPEENGVYHLNHTFVDDSLRGQSIAGKLVQKVVDTARKENKKIHPTCSYAVKWFEKNGGNEDILAK